VPPLNEAVVESVALCPESITVGVTEIAGAMRAMLIVVTWIVDELDEGCTPQYTLDSPLLMTRLVPKVSGAKLTELVARTAGDVHELPRFVETETHTVYGFSTPLL
jgi:replicative superfamily II helicase